MSNLFKNKVVIVTGASSGIGEATAREFALQRTQISSEVGVMKNQM